ncbi:MAG: hypothetical protein OXP68_07980 [Anaerolineaceae bacterium]|nr:hypothetical protein [Anaerolineaceae bacterium]
MLAENHLFHLFVTRLYRVLMWAALILLFGYLLVFLTYAANLIQFPFDYDQGEGFELVDTLLFSQGRWPWQDVETWPFYSSNYPPLFHLLAVPFAWLFGPSYAYGRALGTLATLIAAGAIAFAVRRDGGPGLLAPVSGLAFIASNTIYHIGPLNRQHMSMVMFETLAVVVLANMEGTGDTQKRRRTYWLGLLLILAAGYTKQLALATALAAIAFLFIRQPRRGLQMAVGLALSGGAIFLLLTLATDGQWWLQTISANVNRYDPQQALGLLQQWFGLHGFLVVPALLFLLYELYVDRLSIYSVWLVAALAVGLFSGKWGAGDSYFSTAIAATCILAGVGCTRLLANLSGKGTLRSALALLLIPLLFLGYARAVLHLPTLTAPFDSIAALLDVKPNALNGFYDSARGREGEFPPGYADIGHLTNGEDIRSGEELVTLVRAADGPVLSEDASFALLAGKEVVTNPTQLLNLANNGLYRGDALLQMLQDQAFGLIILRAGFFPGTVLQAIGENYEPDQVIRMNGFDYRLYRPKAERAP